MRDWWRSAHCKGTELDPFGAPSKQQEFKTTHCDHCPVQQECLAAALTEEQYEHFAYGVRGGVGAKARTKMIQKRRAGA